MRKSAGENSWLEPVLRRNLRRVSAPPELWDRIVLPRMEDAPQENRSFLWVLAAASVLAVSVLAVGWGYYPGVGAPGLGAEFRSNQVADVRTWIWKRTGLDIPLLREPNRDIEVLGARVTGAQAVKLHYRAGNQNVSLQVSASVSGLPEHTHLDRTTLQNATTVSWKLGRQAYTLAVPHVGGMAVACLVCHTDLTL